MSVNPRVSLFNTITYTRDALGLASKINNIAFTYDKNSIQTQLDYPNQSKEKNSFDAIYNIKKIESANQTLDYTQDKTGLITKKNNTNYTYDKIGRLTQAGADSFSYDKAGNNQNKSAVYNILNNQMSENALYRITYDAMGNIASKYNKLDKTTSKYTFNARNQLVSYEQLDDANQTTKTLTYTYDAFNRRVSKTDTSAGSATVTQKYLYDGDDIVAILDSNNQVIATITHDESIDTPLSITNANGTFYYHRDHQGSIIALTDSSGVVESFTYDNHYGTITNHAKTTETNNPYAYTGRELDTNELYYYRARYYDPSLQRFLGEDPIKFRSGDFNYYRYVLGDPVGLLDPSGLKTRGALGTRTTKKLGDAIAAAASSAGAAIANAIDNAFPDNTSCGSTCDEKYPGYKKCNDLPYGYDYSSEDSAWKNGFLSGIGGFKKHSRKPVTHGPCAGYPGEHIHINIRSGSGRGGSMTSCQCCDDSSGNAILKTRWKVHY